MRGHQEALFWQKLAFLFYSTRFLQLVALSFCLCCRDECEKLAFLVYAQLAVNLADVRAHGVFRDEEFFCDGRPGAAVREQFPSLRLQRLLLAAVDAVERASQSAATSRRLRVLRALPSRASSRAFSCASASTACT